METHIHCETCVLANCKQTAHCPISYCPNACGISTHQCKILLHVEQTCPEGLEACPNNKAGNGCTEVLKRRLIAQHIQHCVASIVPCIFSHQRVDQPIINLPEIGAINSDSGGLIDAKFAETDLYIWENNKLEIIKNSQASVQNFWVPKRIELVRSKKEATLAIADYSQPEKAFQSNEKGSQDTPVLSLDTNIGLMNNYYWMKERLFSNDMLQNRHRACIDTGITRPFSSYYSTASKLQHNYRTCTFLCNDFVKRNEFSDHWKTLHLDIELAELVRRCPMRIYGCNHGVLDLTPSGAELVCDQDTDSFLVDYPTTVTPAEPCDEAELRKREELALYGYEFEDQQLGQLPAEVLMLICQYLDSQSLWMLSMVSHYMREVCVTVAKRLGIVYYRWEKKAPGCWATGPKIVSFSKGCPDVKAWTYTNKPTISNHMTSCDFLSANRKTISEPTLVIFKYDLMKKI